VSQCIACGEVVRPVWTSAAAPYASAIATSTRCTRHRSSRHCSDGPELSGGSCRAAVEPGRREASIRLHLKAAAGEGSRLRRQLHHKAMHGSTGAARSQESRRSGPESLAAGLTDLRPRSAETLRELAEQALAPCRAACEVLPGLTSGVDLCSLVPRREDALCRSNRQWWKPA